MQVNNGNSILGNNFLGVNKASHITIAGGIINYNAITARQYHSLAFTDTGVLYTWNQDLAGRIGDNTDTNRRSPVTVIDGTTNCRHISFFSLSTTSDIEQGGFNLALKKFLYKKINKLYYNIFMRYIL